MDKKHYVLVTNTHRGIYFGELIELKKNRAVLKNARHCFYYSAGSEARGTFSLATHGPQKGSKIGPALSRMTILDVATVSDCTEEAVALWLDSSW